MRDRRVARRRLPSLRTSFLGLAGTALVALAVPDAGAHERDFTLSRDWHLPYQGENEIESRTFWKTKPNDIVQELEYEYGVTDHFALEPGLEFVHRNSEEFELEAAEIELRFNFREFDFHKLLPAMNLEYERRIKTD